MVKQISKDEYIIDNLPGFEQYGFSESSPGPLNLPESVAYATAHNGVLQSGGMAWAVRVSANDRFDSDKYQSTRTAVLGVQIDGNYYLAIDDSSDPATNILLARPQEGYNAHSNIGKWLLPKNDPIIKRMLDRAANTGRVLPAPPKEIVLPTTPGADGRSVYGSNAYTPALLGEDLAASVATYLNSKGYRNVYVWALSPDSLDRLGVDNDHVEVRRLGVGGVCNVDANYLDANDQCDNYGRARGVRNIFSGNRGGL
jgi:hypothetical protein